MNKDAKKILAGLLDEMLPRRAAPRIGLVKKVYTAAGKGSYALDAELVLAGSLEKTGVVLPSIPISPLWAGAGGRGLYALPAVGQLVVIGFIEWDMAFPYVAGIWSDTYEAAGHPEGTFIITDGKSTFSIDVDGLFKFEIVKDEKVSLKGLLEKLVDEIEAIETIGPPPRHVINPATKLKFEAYKLQIAQLLK